MSDDRFAAAAWWIEIGVEDARGAEELQLPGRAFANVQARLAAQPDQVSRILAHHAFQALDRVARRRRLAGRRSWSFRRRRDAAGEQGGGYHVQPEFHFQCCSPTEIAGITK